MSKQWGDIGKGMAIGGIVGVVTGVLCAPRSGKETREGIRKKAEELTMKTKEEYNKTLDKTKKAYDAMASRLKHAKEEGKYESEP
jgi:gas vesicle protein